CARFPIYDGYYFDYW
nr:immunoglobulin heavy chain junction region [Mus musculus]MBK4189943.1 immunoglobulin heavy chain junction region [Mus musculus]MBK4189944.1 immunoglobulin heavy chain junction region [Mus musculus]MBK4189945.1 immunoglobulin heavy chain junction region [Mus musculus]MBK4189946.1 immunoglobulin heavy chain junction region [Mus musculus]